MIISDIKTKQTLVNYWNSYFNAIPNVSLNIDNKPIDGMDFFDNYLKEIPTNNITFTNKIAYVEKSQYNEIVIWNNISNFAVYNKKMLESLNIYDFVITNFPLELDNETIILRKEIIDNVFSSSKSHFFDKDLPFPSTDISVYYTDKFYNMLIENKERLNSLIFKTKLLNYFERGKKFNNITIKPKISLSDYGRWYFNDFKIQNNKDFRIETENKLKQLGSLITVDMVSGEPTIFSKRSNSKEIQYLLSLRKMLKSNKETKKYAEMIKNMINVYIHSINDPVTSYNWFKKNNYELCTEFENNFGISLLDNYCAIFKELESYNNKVINDFKKNMCYIEPDRRIVNPFSVITSNKDILKFHRNFLQGGTNDTIIDVLKRLCDSKVITMENIMWTIFDSFTLLVNPNMKDLVIEKIKNIGQEINVNLSIDK